MAPHSCEFSWSSPPAIRGPEGGEERRGPRPTLRALAGLAADRHGRADLELNRGLLAGRGVVRAERDERGRVEMKAHGRLVRGVRHAVDRGGSLHGGSARGKRAVPQELELLPGASPAIAPLVDRAGKDE